MGFCLQSQNTWMAALCVIAYVKHNGLGLGNVPEEKLNLVVVICIE